MVSKKALKALTVSIIKKDLDYGLHFFFKGTNNLSDSKKVTHERKSILNNVQLEHSGLIEVEKPATLGATNYCGVMPSGIIRNDNI